MMLISIIILSFFTKLQNSINLICFCKNNSIVFYLNEKNFKQLNQNNSFELIIQNKTLNLNVEKLKPIKITSKNLNYLMHLNSLKKNDWGFKFKVKFNSLNEGFFPGQILLNKINPISLIL